MHPRGKTPLGTLATSGSLSAQTDQDIVRGWWRAQPDANIGLRTGVVFDVLDLDSEEAVKTLMTLSPDYHHTGPVSATGKGHHLLFATSGAKNAAKLVGVPLDFRGLNGYIVAPPSIHPEGHTYRWHREGNGELPSIPQWLHDLLFPPPVERKSDLSPEHIAAAANSLPPIINMVNLLAKGPLIPAGHKNGGQVWKTNCFLGTHSDSDPSFFVYEWDDSFYCHACGRGGDRSMQGWGDRLNLQNFINNGRLR